uniref:asparaginase n=1 Tax=Globodera pallida TaxID=36090 RepID=A0A183BN56_GLOPA
MSDEISTILSHHHRQHHAAAAAAGAADAGDGAATTARPVPPVLAPSPPMPPIDHSFQPKHLTAVANLDDSADDDEGNLVRNLSATTLAEMHAEREANGILPPQQQQQQQQQQQHTGRRRLSTVCEDGHAHGKMVALHDSKVLVLYTGGTIGMRTCPAGVYAPEQHYLPRAIRDIPPLNDKEYAERMYADLPLKPLCLPPVRGMSKRVVYWVVEYEPLLDSSDMTFDDWIRIAKEFRTFLLASGCVRKLRAPSTPTPNKCQVERGCLVVNVSQCAKGQVATSYMTAKILDDAGVIFGSDMTTEAALAKLAYVLAKQEWSIEQKAAMLRKNLAGELSVAHSDAQLVGELDIIPRLAKYLSITSSSETRMLRNALFPPLSCHAAFANDVQTLEHGASVHIRDANDENALLCAVRSRNLVAIKMVRQAGGQLVLPRPRIGVELCLSAGSGDLEALKAWNAAGANLSTTDYDGRTALHVAAARGLDEMCYWLCENGADPLVRDRLGRTPAEDARANIDEHMVEGLLAPNFQRIFALFGTPWKGGSGGGGT